MKKINADFEVIMKLVEKKRAQIVQKINDAYDKHLIKSVDFQAGLTALYQTM